MFKVVTRTLHVGGSEKYPLVRNPSATAHPICHLGQTGTDCRACTEHAVKIKGLLLFALHYDAFFDPRRRLT